MTDLHEYVIINTNDIQYLQLINQVSQAISISALLCVKSIETVRNVGYVILEVLIDFSNTYK